MLASEPIPESVTFDAGGVLVHIRRRGLLFQPGSVVVKIRPALRIAELWVLAHDSWSEKRNRFKGHGGKANGS